MWPRAITWLQALRSIRREAVLTWESKGLGSHFNVGFETKPQRSACFILSIEDSMESILDWIRRECIVFRGGSGRLLDRFVLEMEAGGYRVLSPQILNASRYGVPQDRRRLVILGYQDGVIAPEYPRPTVRPLPKRAAGPARPWEAGGTAEDESLPVGPSVRDASATYRTSARTKNYNSVRRSG